MKAGSWYVITALGELIQCESEYHSYIVCSDLGTVWTSGYAKHLAPYEVGE